MTLVLDDEEAIRLAEELARLRNLPVEEALVQALEFAVAREDAKACAGQPTALADDFRVGIECTDRNAMTIEIKILGRGDESALENAAPGVFDNAVDAALAAEFLGDPRHHIAVAIEDGVVVGFVSAVHYVHPDKPAQLFLNEVAVAQSHQSHGIGKSVLETMLEHGRALKCTEAWVLTDRANTPAMRLYASANGVERPSDQVMFTFRLA